jgi:MFS family permease
MYAFRKPFTVAHFENQFLLGIQLKIILVIAQLVGYTSSKFFGIKFISEISGKKRAIAIVSLIGISEVALLLFGISPNWLKVFFIFLNGLPLGMVWGLVFSYLEGRKLTELMGAGLCVSFIFASGFAKSVGKFLMLNFSITESWMPFCTGLVFIIPLLTSVYLLSKTPAPNAEDISNKKLRKPMTPAERKLFLSKYAIGLILLISAYVLLTVFRDFRDNFIAEIWAALGYGEMPSVFSTSETYVSLGVLVLIGGMFLIKNNHFAFYVNHLLILLGFILLGISIYLFSIHIISPMVWMILNGLGLYMAYVPFNCMLFDRIIAVTKEHANAGFLIYLADSFGYLGSVLVLLYKNFGSKNIGWLAFFQKGGYLVSFTGIILITLSFVYFLFRLQLNSENEKQF